MNISDLAHANDLYREIAELRQAIEFLDHNATITAVELTVPPPPPLEPATEGTEPSDEQQWSPNRQTLLVSTATMTHPPQMLAAIRAQEEARIKAIDDELAAMGVTIAEAAA